MSAMMMKELELIEKLQDMNLRLHTGAGHVRCSMMSSQVEKADS